MTVLPLAKALFDILGESCAGEHITADKLLPTLLPFAVEMRMLELREKGGPDVADCLRAREFGKQASEGPEQQAGDPDTFLPHPRMGLADGSDLLYSSQSGKGATATMFNELANSLAVLSFVPGGIHFAGMGWHSLPGEFENCSRCYKTTEATEALPQKRVRKPRLHKQRQRRH